MLTQPPNYWFWKKEISPKEIKTLNQKIEKNKCEGLDVPAENVTKTSYVKIVEAKALQESMNRFIEQAYLSNFENFGYNLYPPIFRCWNFNKYDSKNKGEYDWHVDSSNSNVYDTKLTLILNISDQKYEGGDFQIYGTGTTPEFKKAGDMILFHSYLPHKVTPVIKGVRKTLTVFLNGPKLI
ncbi:MAG TPA: hypothetical protein DHV22_10175 [Xanthomarina gelatinilytica]|uniref:Fe2OG dioxygenase domain-containing protein n=1 Tax=Xanthomarina gelatinilytica TaxID=1137281 RepID=A0A3D6BRP8_9FLAO|nr:hypothetical protein [Xanthomarina gelatinilytica]|tara:strand:- start:593 stop:1138 length:546 start_codon:yes stop_codon:yes gene_type:complete